MPVKKYKPTSPGRRNMSVSTFDEITKHKPEKSLIEPLKKHSGRNNQGRLTVRHRGGGNKRFYRRIDFKRDKHGVPARVAGIEYDPNRSANIALLFYRDGEKRYILAPDQLKVGDRVESGPDAEARVGNALPLARIPLGLPVHNLELQPGRGGRLVRGAGGGAQIMSREGGYAQIRLPSGEIRLIRSDCYATVGQVGNSEHQARSLGKAGRKRWQGIRPTVRGVAMNPVDHPMGGGEGRASGGHPESPWGWQTKGHRTRSRKNASNRFIVKRRSK